MDKDSDGKDYEVGYGKPPKHSQFKPGQSGNPAGRPKDSRNIKTVLRDVAREMVDIKEDGRRMRISKQEAMIRALMARGANGDNRATKIVIDLLAKSPGHMDRYNSHDDW